MPDLTFTNLGAQQSKPDYRDHVDVVLAGAPPPTYQTTYSPPVADFNQEKIGICTSALVSIIEYVYYVKTGTYTKLSRRFLYAVGKNLIDGNTFEGSSPRTMLKAAYNYGACPDSLYPSAVNGMSHADYVDLSKIPATAWAEAKKFKIGGYVSVGTDPDALRAALYKYGFLYTRMELGKEWWTASNGTITWDKQFINPLRPPALVVSGHAVIPFGYTETHIKLLNDWSLAWCDNDTALFNPITYPVTEAWAITTENIPNDLPPAESFKHNFITAMQRGQRNEEVRNLQIALMIGGDMEYVQPLDRGYYGQLTQDGVLRYQIRKKIPLSWTERYVYSGRYCGPKTLAVLNAEFNT